MNEVVKSVWYEQHNQYGDVTNKKKSVGAKNMSGKGRKVTIWLMRQNSFYSIFSYIPRWWLYRVWGQCCRWKYEKVRARIFWSWETGRAGDLKKKTIVFNIYINFISVTNNWKPTPKNIKFWLSIFALRSYKWIFRVSPRLLGVWSKSRLFLIDIIRSLCGKSSFS